MGPNEQTTTISNGADESSIEATLLEDTLVEEISIDGMCGVY